MKKFLTMATLFAAMTASAYTTVPSADLHVWLEIPTIVADGETVNYIKVYEHDDQDLVYTSFNMEFILPEGFLVNKVKEGRNEVNDIHLTDRADVTHSIACNLLDGVDLRILAYSSVNADFFQDDLDGNPLDHLFTVGLIAEPTLASGEYNLDLTGVKFVMSNGDATVPVQEPIQFPFTVVSTTSIEELDADKIDAGREYYDLQGHPVNPSVLPKGTVIVSYGKKFIVR